MIMPVLGKAAAIMGCTVLGVAALAYSGGVVDVQVDEKRPNGQHIHLPLPALGAVAVVEMVPSRHFAHGTRDFEQFAPVIHAVAKELENCPDTVLVEVQDDHETVHIAKDGNYLVIDVDNRQEKVHVSFPIRMMATVLDVVANKAHRANERVVTDDPQPSRPAI